MQEGMLKAANEVLQEKVQIVNRVWPTNFLQVLCHTWLKLMVWMWCCMQIVEQSGLLDVGMMVAAQQNGHFSTVPLIEEITNPLTILSGYSNCRGSEMGYSF